VHAQVLRFRNLVVFGGQLADSCNGLPQEMRSFYGTL
jgi:hypothetical protein